MRVELRHIDKRFGSVQANVDVSLTLEAGTIQGLLGENGAGKSTLVKILSGFMSRDGGEILLNGQPRILKTPQAAIQAGIGMLHQDPLDFPNLTVLENFLSGGSPWTWLHRQRACDALQRISEDLHFSLAPNEVLTNLSVGERQQLEIVRLLSLGVQTLILDEPTTGISASQKTALFAAMQQLAATGKSILFVSHKLADVAHLCHSVTIMQRGAVVGHRSMPCPDEELVALMFGKPLQPPQKPLTCQPHPHLQLQQLQVGNHRLHVTIPNLVLRRGEVLGLAGLEGSGQDLLLRSCAGLLSSLRGQIHLANHDLTHRPYRDYQQAGVGYIPADRLREGLISGLSIQEHTQLRHPGPSVIIDRRTSLQRTQAMIAQFSIRGQALTRVERLSGGNQQRTQLGLMPEHLELILLEHPTRGLDIESADWIWQQLLSRCREGAAIIFMSSDLDELRQYSDRIMVFSGGEASAAIPVAELGLDQLGHMMGGQLRPVPG